MSAEHAIRAVIETAPSVGPREWPAAPDRAAYHGLAGEVVAALAPHTESDPVALLVQFLVAFGNAVGRGPHFMAEADRHGVNLFAVMVGDTAKGRKGTSWGQVKRVMADTGQLAFGSEENWFNCIASGLSSGEGVIWQVRDPIEKQEPIKQNGRVTGYHTVVTDQGVTDKRLLVYEAEFASALRVLLREGNTLSAVIRNAWDGGDLRSLTKNSPARATGAHISIIGHVTRDELLRYLDATEAANGFANRFLWVCVRRSKQLPDGGALDERDIALLQAKVGDALRAARTLGGIARNQDARLIWHEVYGQLSEGRPGLLGAVIARAEAQVMRLALVYAILDGAGEIRPPHLRAALALWEYCEASAEYIFGDRFGDPTADAILDALRQKPEGMTRTELRDLFGRNSPGSRIETALATLLRANRVSRRSERTQGRSAETWALVV